MKKFVFILIAMAFVISGCNFFPKSDTEDNSGGNLIVHLGDTDPAARAITTGARLPEDVRASFRYELSLTGPGGEVRSATVPGMENLNLTVPLGNWRIDAAAYQQDVQAGTGSLTFRVAAGSNTIRIPMSMSGSCYDIEIPAMDGLTITANPSAAFPGTTVGLTAVILTSVVPAASGAPFILPRVTEKNSGNPVSLSGSGLFYTFEMPAADVTVSVQQNRVTFVFEGPEDEHFEPGPGADLSWKDDTPLSLAVTGAYDNYQWYLDGLPLTGETTAILSRTARDFSVAAHRISVRVTRADGNIYSKEATFNVVTGL
jgi:hypothetical protein